MSEPLSGEEERLLYLFAQQSCNCEYVDDSSDCISHGTVIVTRFIDRFNADPAAFRQEIAPGREPMQEQSDVEGGER